MRRALPLLIVWSIALMLGACGTTEAAKPAESQSGGDPITVTDSAGRTVTLPAGPAKRVVALEWQQTDNVLELGVTPVGISDLKGYRSWVGTGQPLTGESEDVGRRTEPSLERIAALDPDLIIGVKRSIPEGALAQAEKIAPVVLMAGSGPKPLEVVSEEFRLTARLLGKSAAAEKVLSELDGRLEQNAERVRAAGRRQPVVLISPSLTGSTVSLRMHGPNSAPAVVGSRLGLEPAWLDPGDAAWGLSQTDIEGLTKLPPNSRLFIWDNDNVDLTPLESNGLWTSLDAVRSGHVDRIAEGVWVYGGPRSLMVYSDQLTEAVLSGA